MTKEELKKYRREVGFELLKKLPFEFVNDTKVDDYGVYCTGMFEYKGKTIFINKEDGLWHLSVSANHPLGYFEMKEVRYKFMPNDMQVAQIFPPREQFVNIHENCYHLFQLNESEEGNGQK